MSEPGSSFEEETFSSDTSNDIDTAVANSNVNSDDSSSMSIDVHEPEPWDDVPEWKGVSMDEIRKGLGVYDSQELPPICPSSSHTVLVSLPLPGHGIPKPYPTHQVDKWCQDYVRMPHSKHSVYLIEEVKKHDTQASRWEIIQESLLQNFVSIQQLESAILSYNHIYAQRWDFAALHHFFSEVVDREETDIFFETLMPKMVQLALQLPVLVTGPMPLLKRHANGAISLSQLQIASLLANAFFCTFPRRNSTNPQSEYGRYPYINFNRLFSAYKDGKWNKCESVTEKMKCIFHYFRRVTTKGGAAPEGVVTIQRRYIPKADCPKWDEQTQKLLPLHITSKGTIETEGTGLLQVDFANKYVGGGVLGLGCVQEEIRFVICPELMVTMLVTEELDDTEALIVSGVERYSKYKGYSNTFKWMGDYLDETPKDSSGRRLTSIVAIDALYFSRPQSQFSINNIIRELNKAYVGFVGCEGNKSNLPAVATGNWGCGAFRGNPKLKVLLQLMAATITGRSMVYFTFGDTNLRDDIADIYTHFVKHETNIAHIFTLLIQYQEFASNKSIDFYSFLQKRSTMKPVAQYLSKGVYSIASTTKVSYFRRSKSVQNEEKETYQPEIKYLQDIEEDKIQGWLSEIEEAAGNKRKPMVSSEETEDLKTGTAKKESQSETISEKEEEAENGCENMEKNKKQNLWKILDNSLQDKTIPAHRLSGLELLDSKQDLLYRLKNNNDDEILQQVCKMSEDSQASCKSAQTSTEKLASPGDCVSPTKRQGQTKISDFFQRTN